LLPHQLGFEVREVLRRRVLADHVLGAELLPRGEVFAPTVLVLRRSVRVAGARVVDRLARQTEFLRERCRVLDPAVRLLGLEFV
jgi:hypothetical protein